jgi:hypothetical protein
MLIRTTMLIVLVDLYAYMHEIAPQPDGPYNFPTVVVACCGLAIVDIILEKLMHK